MILAPEIDQLEAIRKELRNELAEGVRPILLQVGRPDNAVPRIGGYACPLARCALQSYLKALGQAPSAPQHENRARSIHAVCTSMVTFQELQSTRGAPVKICGDRWCIAHDPDRWPHVMSTLHSLQAGVAEKLQLWQCEVDADTGDLVGFKQGKVRFAPQ